MSDGGSRAKAADVAPSGSVFGRPRKPWLLRYDPPLREGRLIGRRKRFFLDVDVSALCGRGTGEFARGALTLHCANTGSMRSCLREGARVLFSDSGNPGRQLRFSAEAIHSGRGWIGVNTARTNHFAAEVFRQGLLRGFEDFDGMRREAVLPGGRSRCDLLLSQSRSSGDICYVEVKQVSYFDGRTLGFPDAVSERASRHVHELAGLVGPGVRCCLLFVASRPEGDVVSSADAIDPVFGAALREGVRAGLELRAVRVRHGRRGVRFGGELPVRISERSL